MKRKFVLIAALVAALAVVFIGCPYPTNGGGESPSGGSGSVPEQEKPKPTPEPFWKLSTVLASVLGSGTTLTCKNGDATNPIDGKPLQYVGDSELTISKVGSAYTLKVTTGNTWGGGVDIKIGTGADQLNLQAGDVIKITGTTATALFLRLKTDAYDGSTDDTIAVGNIDVTHTVTAVDLTQIAAGSGNIRVGLGNSTPPIEFTITEITVTR